MADFTRMLSNSVRADAVSTRFEDVRPVEAQDTSPAADGSNPDSIVRGREAVTAMKPLLTELGRRTGQVGVLDEIDLLVQAPTALRKLPCLVLVGLPRNVPAAQATADDVQGAVLLYEYTVFGIRSGVVVTDDVNGERTVLAPREMRTEVAEQACRVLIEHGAAVSLVSVSGVLLVPRLIHFMHRSDCDCRLGLRIRTQGRDLLLRDSFEETLSGFGKNTRRNFRRYRHRAETDLGAVFVSRVEIAAEDFLELNRASTNPVDEALAAWRHRFIVCGENRLFAGLRARDGRWLSLIGGTRQAKEVQIEWQVNRAGLPHYSLSTVMRSCLLEHEITLGTRKLVFQGGTPHSMGLSLGLAQTLDAVAVRRGLRGWLVHRLSRWVPPRSNFLGRALEDAAVRWLA